MVNYIYTNSSIILNKLNKMILKSQAEKNIRKCSKCKYESDTDFIYS